MEDLLVEAREGRPIAPIPGPHGPAVRLFYRTYEFLCAVAPCRYHGVGLVAYPSGWIDMTGGWRALRFGVGLGGAGESSQERETWWQHSFVIEALLVLGVQYPWDLTPYAELVVSLGAMHYNWYNKDFVAFTYSFGVEAGLEWFFFHRMHLMLSLGWRRSVVDTQTGKLFVDSLTVQTGFGF